MHASLNSILYCECIYLSESESESVCSLHPLPICPTCLPYYSRTFCQRCLSVSEWVGYNTLNKRMSESTQACDMVLCNRQCHTEPMLVQKKPQEKRNCANCEKTQAKEAGAHKEELGRFGAKTMERLAILLSLALYPFPGKAECVAVKRK